MTDVDLQYNGVVVDPAAVEGVELAPHYDETGTVVVYVEVRVLVVTGE